MALASGPAFVERHLQQEHRDFQRKCGLISSSLTLRHHPTPPPGSLLLPTYSPSSYSSHSPSNLLILPVSHPRSSFWRFSHVFGDMTPDLHHNKVKKHSHLIYKNSRRAICVTPAKVKTSSRKNNLETSLPYRQRLGFSLHNQEGD